MILQRILKRLGRIAEGKKRSSAFAFCSEEGDREEEEG